MHSPDFDNCSFGYNTIAEVSDVFKDTIQCNIVRIILYGGSFGTEVNGYLINAFFGKKFFFDLNGT